MRFLYQQHDNYATGAKHQGIGSWDTNAIAQFPIFRTHRMCPHCYSDKDRIHRQNGIFTFRGSHRPKEILPPLLGPLYSPFRYWHGGATQGALARPGSSPAATTLSIAKESGTCTWDSSAKTYWPLQTMTKPLVSMSVTASKTGYNNKKETGSRSLRDLQSITVTTWGATYRLRPLLVVPRCPLRH